MARGVATICGSVFLLSVVGFADTPCYGPGDVDGDGLVGSGDLRAFAECLAGPEVTTPPPGCDPLVFARADSDADDDVDLLDFAAAALNVGASYFDFDPHRDNLEAEMLAMDLSGRLRAPDGEYERILRDLALIRAEFDRLATVIDDMDYVPNELLVGLEDGQPLDDYQALNDYYQLVEEELHYSFRVLRFCDNLNAPVLAPDYAALPAVRWADPNWFIGHDDYITISVIGTTYRYDIDDGFTDCFDGCDCHRYWVIDVDASGAVTLISYDEVGLPWCDFGD